MGKLFANSGEPCQMPHSAVSDLGLHCLLITLFLGFSRLKWVNMFNSRPRWLNWMRRLTGDQEVAGSTPSEVGNILSWRLIMKYFLRSFSPFR